MDNELDALRTRVAELEAEIERLEDHRRVLAKRCNQKDLELDELKHWHSLRHITSQR